MKALVFILMFVFACTPGENLDTSVSDDELVLDKSGLIIDKDLPVVLTNCTGCHSGKLIGQNRATREGWEEMIVWMQATQNLHDLGENELIILDYLEKYYGPKESGRRKQLMITDWYKLE